MTRGFSRFIPSTQETQTQSTGSPVLLKTNLQIRTLPEFDLDRAIRDQVIAQLEASPILPLERGAGPKESGIYALYHDAEVVYIGKASRETTKSKRDLRSRLNEHVGKIEGRQNIRLEKMHCRYLTFDSDWWVLAAEIAIIRYYEPVWNASGFGSKTPGKGRPGTSRVSKWDQQYPPLTG